MINWRRADPSIQRLVLLIFQLLAWLNHYTNSCCYLFCLLLFCLLILFLSNQAEKIAIGENLEEKRSFLQKIGSNWTLRNKIVSFQALNEWKIKSWSIFMISLEPILSKIPKKSIAPPRRRSLRSHASQKNFLYIFYFTRANPFF